MLSGSSDTAPGMVEGPDKTPRGALGTDGVRLLGGVLGGGGVGRAETEADGIFELEEGACGVSPLLAGDMKVLCTAVRMSAPCAMALRADSASSVLQAQRSASSAVIDVSLSPSITAPLSALIALVVAVGTVTLDE